MTTLNLAEIETRLQDNKLEMAALSQRYDQMVAEFDQHQKEHTAKLQQHQQRYQQCVGAAAALEQLKRLLTDEGVAHPENGDAPPRPPKLVNRLAKK